MTRPRWRTACAAKRKASSRRKPNVFCRRWISSRARNSKRYAKWRSPRATKTIGCASGSRRSKPSLARRRGLKAALPQPGHLTLVDGRQSDMALAIARGTRRLLRNLRFSTLTELPLASGRRADVVALAADGTIVIVEIKSSLADFRADQKWPDYRAHCDRLYFAISDNLAPEIMPAEAGLIVADAFGAAVLRE